jgi:hypothetical protein
MLCVQRLTRGVGPAANTVNGAAPWRLAPATVLPDGKKTPYNLSTTIDPLAARVGELRHTGLAALRRGHQSWRRWLLRYLTAHENVNRVHPVCTRSGVLARLQGSARPQQHQPACGGELEGPR